MQWYRGGRRWAGEARRSAIVEVKHRYTPPVPARPTRQLLRRVEGNTNNTAHSTACCQKARLPCSQPVLTTVIAVGNACTHSTIGARGSPHKLLLGTHWELA